MSSGQITHLDIPSDDLERAKRFYSGVFGWQIAAVPGFDDYEMARTGENQGAGIGIRGETAPQGIRVYVTVDSLDDALVAVERLGGSVAVEKTEVPGMGWYAAVIDTEGGEIGIWQDAAG